MAHASQEREHFVMCFANNYKTANMVKMYVYRDFFTEAENSSGSDSFRKEGRLLELCIFCIE